VDEQRDKSGVGSLVKFRGSVPTGQRLGPTSTHSTFLFLVFISEPANFWENLSCDSDLWLYIAEEVADFCVPGLYKHCAVAS
jgi:hypothetical protein